jgi:hypothetical protein
MCDNVEIFLLFFSGAAGLSQTAASQLHPEPLLDCRATEKQKKRNFLRLLDYKQATPNGVCVGWRRP